MPKYPYKFPGVKLGRRFREDWKQNLKDIESDIKELNGAQLDALDAADFANKKGNFADEKGDYAKTQGDYAKAQGNYAKDAADSAVESTNTIHNDDSNTTYNWGLKHKNGHVIFMFEEV